jgi:hypothetical protein
MTAARFLAAPLLALLAPLAPLSACPWHGDMFGGEPGGYLMEPVGGAPTDLAPAGTAQAAQPTLSREELMARQRELFLARYPQLAAGAGDKAAAAPQAPATGN